jgi:hypothetical protein
MALTNPVPASSGPLLLPGPQRYPNPFSISSLPPHLTWAQRLGEPRSCEYAWVRSGTSLPEYYCVCIYQATRSWGPDSWLALLHACIHSLAHSFTDTLNVLLSVPGFELGQVLGPQRRMELSACLPGVPLPSKGDHWEVRARHRHYDPDLWDKQTPSALNTVEDGVEL